MKTYEAENSVSQRAPEGDAADPLADTTNTNQNTTAETAPAATNGATAEEKTRAARPPRQRGPPEDGIPSKNKVMVANLPYDLSEDKV